MSERTAKQSAFYASKWPTVDSTKQTAKQTTTVCSNCPAFEPAVTKTQFTA